MSVYDYELVATKRAGSLIDPYDAICGTCGYRNGAHYGADQADCPIVAPNGGLMRNPEEDERTYWSNGKPEVYVEPTEADRKAAHLLIGCQYPDFCGWEGVCEVQYMNSLGPKYRSCREHAASFRRDDDYAVRDSGRQNRQLLRYAS